MIMDVQWLTDLSVLLLISMDYHHFASMNAYSLAFVVLLRFSFLFLGNKASYNSLHDTETFLRSNVSVIEARDSIICCRFMKAVTVFHNS